MSSSGWARLRPGFHTPERLTNPGDELAKLEIEFDQAKANQILDSLGLMDTDGDGIRNRADGKNISASKSESTMWRALAIAEFVKQDWADIGIELNFDVDPRLVQITSGTTVPPTSESLQTIRPTSTTRGTSPGPTWLHSSPGLISPK